MTRILFTVADVEMAQFAIPFGQQVRNLRNLGIEAGRIASRTLPGIAIGAGATYLRRTASGAVSVVRNNPGKTAGAAGALALTAAGATYLLNKRKKKRKQDYSRQIRTVYFSRRHK